MIETSMLDFAKTGTLGPLHVGLTRAEVQRLLGPPTDHMAGKSLQRSPIWRYGKVEFYFDDASGKVTRIFADHDDLTRGSETLRIRPWIVKRGFECSRMEAELRRLRSDYRVALVPACPEQRYLITTSGAAFGFFESEWGGHEPGLYAWHTFNADEKWLRFES